MMLRATAAPLAPEETFVSVTHQESPTSFEAGVVAGRRGRGAWLAPGEVLAQRYEIRRWLGQGGAATVYQVWDRMLSGVIAMKIFRPEQRSDGRMLQRLAREVRLARRVRHRNVCSVFDLGCADGLWFLTMEEATGGSLSDGMAAAGDDHLDSSVVSRPWYLRVDDAASLAAGLAAIHEAGIAHRDVTPRNVLRMADGRLVLADFGLAQPDEEEISRHGGTMKYLAPEVAMGAPADKRSDVWQLGMVMHELLFDARPQWTIRDDRTFWQPPDMRDAPSGATNVVAVVAACLAMDPDRRPTAATVDRTLATSPNLG